MATLKLIRVAALAVVCLMLPVGCGSDEDTGPRETTLEGDRLPEHDPTPTPPRPRARPTIDVSGAPTEAHRALGRLFPTEGVRRDSVTWGAWDGQEAEFADTDPAQAPLPVVSARYESSQFRVVDGPEAEAQELEAEPQRVNLFLIRCPDAQAAEVVARNIRAKLEGRDFTERSPNVLAVGGEDEGLTIRRYAYIEQREDEDLVYVGYVNVIDNLVVYALETSQAVPIVDRDGNRVELPTGDLGGRRVGAQIVTLVLYHASAGR